MTLTDREIKLDHLLREARQAMADQKMEIDRLKALPGSYGIVIRVDQKTHTVDVRVGSGIKKMAAPDEDIAVGCEVVLNSEGVIIEVHPPRVYGEVVNVNEVLSDGRVIVSDEHDSEGVAEVAQGCELLRAGDRVRRDVAGLVLEKLPPSSVETLLLEEVPDVSYSDIGGLDAQITEISDAVELPIEYSDLFKQYNLPAPKGVLLYGPPGCGKTMIAKAVAASLARKSGQSGSYFINVKGPELLNKYVGETERQIRKVFQRAREKAEEGKPVIIFFDEIESLFRTRGSGISSDMESTIVPQLLAEMDGVESLKNVIVIGASNRQDLIDPAVLRPGRLDVKIKIDRPDKAAAHSIFAKHLTADIPIAASELQTSRDVDHAIEQMISLTAEAMYAEDEDTAFLEVTYQNGDKETMYFKDFSSGAMIENIVARAKKTAIKRNIAKGNSGIGVRLTDLRNAVAQEFKEHEDLPNTTNPDDWAKISGKKGEKIVFVRTLIKDHTKETGRAIDPVATGQYL